MKKSILKNLTIVSASLLLFFFQGCSQFETPLEMPETGTIQVITTPDSKCTLYRSTNLIMEWTGSKVIPGMLAGSYKVKITSDKYNSSLEESFQLGVSQRKNLEIGTGGLDIKIKSNFLWEVLKDSKSILSGKGSFKVDTLWTGDYKIKVVVPGVANNFLRDISITKAQTYLLEMEYGSLDVRLPSDMDAVLLSGSTELATWKGSIIIDSLWVGSYKVRIKVNPLLPDYEESFTLTKQQNKVVELEYGSLDVRVQNQMECALFRGTIQIDSWSGSRKYDSLWVGDYTVKVKVNPQLPDYEASFTLTKQQIKVVEPQFASFIIETKSDYENFLFLEGVEQLSWTGSKEFNPFIAGNYILKSKMFPSASAVEQSFTIQQNENKIIEWEYGKIDITAPGATCKLKRNGVEQLWWQGNNIFDSIITGNYSVEIQEASSHPVWIENFILQKDEQKSIAVPYAGIQVSTNVATSITKLNYNGTTIKSVTGNGIISGIVPGNYTLSVEAEGYIMQTENITLSNGQTLQKNVQLVRIPFTQMVTIPAGTFTMGCTGEQSGCYSDEIPIHQVTLSPYEIGKYEVTQKEWRTVMGASPSYFTGDNKPVEQVSWNDIITFCNTLSTREGLTPVYTVSGSTVTANWNANGYRLPTEAEWEYAARGGASSTNTQYSGSNTIGNVAWYSSNSGNTTHDVGTKSPNQLEIYDMSGNVWEWCWDWYSSSYYTSSSQTNPRGPSAGSGRVLRGGSWRDTAGYCRVASRYSSYDPDFRYFSFGFRLARTR